MIPSSAGTAIAFLLLLAPGAIWQWWKSRYRSSAKETVLTETVRSVLISILASVAAALVIGFWVWVPIYDRIDPELFEAKSSTLLTLDIIIASFINSIVACGISLGVAALIWHGRSTVTTMTVWTRAFSSYKSSPHLIVELTDGTTWHGKYISHDLDIESGSRDLQLGRRLKRRKPGENSFSTNTNTEFVLLKDDLIKSIQVIYRSKKDQEATSSESNYWKRLRCWIKDAPLPWRSNSANLQNREDELSAQ